MFAITFNEKPHRAKCAVCEKQIEIPRGFVAYLDGPDIPLHEFGLVCFEHIESNGWRFEPHSEASGSDFVNLLLKLAYHSHKMNDAA